LTGVPVAFVSSHARLGGAEHYLTNLLGRLESDWIRDVVCLEKGPFADQLRAGGVPTTVIATSARPPAILASALRLARRLRTTRPAVVHANGVKAALVAALAPSRVPVVWIKHDFSWDGPLARFIAGRCERVIGVSAAVLETLGSSESRKREVIHNGISPPHHDRAEGRRLLEDAIGAPVGEAVVLVGRLDPVKGHRELLSVAHELRGRRPALRIVFVGGEDPSHRGYEVELRREVRDRGLEDVVTLLGHREDAVALISGCEVLAITTVVDERGFGREGFPYVGLEAMAVGTPVVGYAQGGLPELVGRCGRLTPPGARPALVEEIASLLEEDGLRQDLAACGRERVAREFSLDRMVDAMQRVYRELAT
jgi:glycosyltransferase involved in cell wall biosynthesis